MSPKKLIIALWAVVLAVALAVVFTPSGEGYREYAATQVAPAAKVVASPSDGVTAVSQSASTVVPVADSQTMAVREVGAPALSLSGVVHAMAPSGATSKNTAAPVAETKTNVASGRTAPSVYRPAPQTTMDEREEAAILAGVNRRHFLAACEHDHDLLLASGEKPLYACRGMNAPVGPDTKVITTTPSYPTAQTFLLHSRPGAARKVYLDFTGHTTTGTPWNGAWGKVTFTTPPFSLDANTANFSNAEHAAIQSVWRLMAEDFAGFDVDVTTEDPGVEGLLKTSGGDLNHGMRVIFGPDQNSTGAGGVAYVGSFGALRTPTQTDIPCFVFAGAGASAKFMGEAGSHEVGHTVGLNHDGTAADAYFAGHGTGATSWAPIMGVGYGREIVQWSKGDYAGANNDEDDVAIMRAFIPVVTDEFPGTFAAATFVTGLSADVGGIIATAGDIDILKINAGRGNLVIMPKVALSSPNLRLQIRVLDSSGAVLGTYLGTGATGSMAPRPITVAIPTEGMHFIELNGVGNGTGGDPDGTGVTEGYNDYASVGFYSFTASWPDPVNKPPVANATLSANTTYDYQIQQSAMVNFNGTLSTDPDGVILRYLWDFKDVYPVGATGATASHRYKAPGTYYPTLTVFDDRGASASTTVTVTVNGQPRLPSCSLALVTGSFSRLNSIHDVANATILVQDQFGNPVRRALVYVSASGLVSMSRTAVRTNEFGQVSVTTPGLRRGARGSVTFTVSTVDSPGRPYVNTSLAPVTAVAPTVTLTR
jgi:hypothetical protein